MKECSVCIGCLKYSRYIPVMLRAMMYCCTEPAGAAGPQVLPRKLSAMENLSVITVLRASFYDVPD